MRRCKKNILLVFGYFLIIVILFIPYKLTLFTWDSEKESFAYFNYVESLTATQRKQLERYNQIWRNYCFWKYEMKQKDEEIEISREKREIMLKFPISPYPPVKEINRIYKHGFIFLPWFIRGKIKQKEEDKIYKLCGYLRRLNWMFGLYNYYDFEFFSESKVEQYRINTDIFFIEVTFILLAAGFAYILFCVVLRKEKKEDG